MHTLKRILGLGIQHAVSPFQQLTFNPDKIRPGQLFAVQIGQVTVLEGDTTQVGVRLPEDLSKEWASRTIRGVNGGERFAIETLTIEITNKRSGKSGTFTYYGGGYGSPGLPVGISTKSDWYSFTTKYYLTLQDFGTGCRPRFRRSRRRGGGTHAGQPRRHKKLSA